MGGPAKRASGVDQVSETLKKPARGVASPAHPTQSDLTEVQAKLLSALNRAAADLAYAPLNAARELGLYNLWERMGEREVILRPPTGQTSPEHERALNAHYSLELKFHMKVLADLRSGDLLAFGLRLPLKPSSVPIPIPPGLWYFIAFDTDKRTADGGSWFFQEVRTISVRSLHPADRHELDVALGIIARRLEAEAAGHDDEPATPREPAEGPLGATPGNPLYVSLSGAAERLVLKTETLRRNTRHGKVPDPKPEVAEPPKADAEAPPQGLDPEEPPRPKKDPGPKTLNPEIEAYLRERSAKKICKPTLAEECVHLHAWAKREFAQEIRTKARKLAKLKQLREVHAAVYYQLNPEFDRRRRFQQESD
jgi:hypothetical protein